MDDRDFFLKTASDPIKNIEIISDHSRHSIVFKVTLTSNIVFALKIVFILDEPESEEKKEARPKIGDEPRGKTTTSEIEFEEECFAHSLVSSEDGLHIIAPCFYSKKIWSLDEANAFVVGAPEMYKIYLTKWIEYGCSFGGIVMELLGPEFRSLSAALSETQSKKDGIPDELVKYLPQMLAIILYMSKRGVIMVDPNPENFMVTEHKMGAQPDVKILDFGETINSRMIERFKGYVIDENVDEDKRATFNLFCENYEALKASSASINYTSTNIIEELEKINTFAHSFLKMYSEGDIPEPYREYIDFAKQKNIGILIYVSYVKIDQANATALDQGSDEHTSKKPYTGPVYGGTKRTRRKPTHTKRRGKRRVTRRKRTRRRTRR